MNSFVQPAAQPINDGNSSILPRPPLQAPCEAEAQCAAMVKAGVVYATATEDMDSLTFGSNIMLRHLTTSEAK